MLLW
jgi:acyl-CoA reductase-like NAD-dependent aldehyde dehydrogenase